MTKVEGRTCGEAWMRVEDRRKAGVQETEGVSQSPRRDTRRILEPQEGGSVSRHTQWDGALSKCSGLSRGQTTHPGISYLIPFLILTHPSARFFRPIRHYGFSQSQHSHGILVKHLCHPPRLLMPFLFQPQVCLPQSSVGIILRSSQTVAGWLLLAASRGTQSSSWPASQTINPILLPRSPT